MNQGHFEPEASIPKFWQKKKGNEPTSMQKIAQSMGYEVKKRFSLRRKPCNQSCHYTYSKPSKQIHTKQTVKTPKTDAYQSKQSKHQ